MHQCCHYHNCEDYFLPIGFILDERGEKVLPLDTIMRGMSEGTVMYKVKGPKHWYKRRFKVDVQNMRLSYYPTNKPFCKTKNDKIDIYDIDEVRKGWQSDVFNNMESRIRRSSLRTAIHSNLVTVLKEENCLSVIIVNPNRRVIDLIAPNTYTRDAWVRGLSHLIVTCKTSQNFQEHIRWLKDQVRKADVNNNGSLNFNECLTLLQQLNISMDKKDVRKIFDSANFRKSKINNEDALDPEEFVHFYQTLIRRPELEELMKQHSVSRKTIMGVEELQLFVYREQMEPCTFEEAKMLIKKFEHDEARTSLPHEGEAVSGFLTLKGFQRMLLSVDFNIFNKKHRIVHQDMTQPLNHYYIATSHNTYLLSGQLIGASSVEGYIDALQRGCRCLELDAWDGSDDEPIVFHGYTLTSRIFLKDILVAIRKYAFRTSQYPVILSLENHCSLPYQVKMAEHFKTILGDYLYTTPVSSSETEYPSPDQLARKILIKAKKITDTSSRAPEQEEFDLLEEEVEQEQVMAAATPLQLDLPVLEAPRMKSKIAPELSELVNYFVAVRFSSFEEARNRDFQDMSSFQETNALTLSQEKGAEFVDYNKRHFSRIYPKGTRTDSSNYDPVPFWNAGCQLVALNYQTWDKFMRINEYKFAENGRCGYILKPHILCDNRTSYNPVQVPDNMSPIFINLRVITGQHIPKPNRATTGEIVDPYVVVKVTGHPNDAQKKKTKPIWNNGFNPFWNETFLLTLHVPELAMITFTVKDENVAGKNEILGLFALPFTAMTQGYRHIHLEDVQGKSLVPASLFVHISIATDPASTLKNAPITKAS